MECHRSRTSDLPHGSDELWWDREWDECEGSISVDARPAAATIPCPSPHDGGRVKTSGKDSADWAAFCPSRPLHEQLQAIRRRLWILNATLESLAAKIELADRRRSEVAGGDGPDQPRHSPDASGDERKVLNGGGAVGGWRARWKLARLRSRADRAGRRAAVAINDASTSFGLALKAVRDASIAREKADEAWLVRFDILEGRSMGDQSTGPLDPAVLAQEVRALGNDAYRVLKRPGAEAVEVRALARRIAHLQDQIRGYPFVALACWLASVRQLVVAACINL
jgi:hypothetical protein